MVSFIFIRWSWLFIGISSKNSKNLVVIEKWEIKHSFMNCVVLCCVVFLYWVNIFFCNFQDKRIGIQQYLTLIFVIFINVSARVDCSSRNFKHVILFNFSHIFSSFSLEPAFFNWDLCSEHLPLEWNCSST